MAAVGLRQALCWIERICLVAGAGGLVWLYVNWHEASASHDRARDRLKEQMEYAENAPVIGASSGTPAETPAFVGLLTIPRLGLSVPILPNDSEQTLRVAVGHLPDTPLPWEEGNTAIAGHRDTFFRPLKDIRAGDEVQVVTAGGAFRYRVLQTVVVKPEDVWVLRSWEGIRLTLVTCYPFSYVGAALQRFVVHAERM